MQIIMKSVAELKPYVNNPRKNDKAVSKVAESIKRFGFNVPLTITKDGEIATGHTRLKAAILLGMTEVPCIILDGLNEEEIKAWRLVDNRTSEFAEWDFPKLTEELGKITGIDLSAFEFKSPDEAAGLHEDNYKIEIPKTPKSKLGEIYQLGDHRVMCGDSTDSEQIQQLMGGKYADLVVTDPPYNVNYGGRGKQYTDKGGYKCGMDQRTIINDNMDDQRFSAFLHDSFVAFRDALKQGGSFYVWHSDSNGNIFRDALEATGLKVRQCLIWKKNTLVLGRQDYQWIHEPCLYGWKEGSGHYFVNDRGFITVLELDKQDYSTMSKAQLLRVIHNLETPGQAVTVLEEDKPRSNDLHPTMKPVRLIGRLIANSSKKGQIVLDPFGGSGTTIVASEQLNRKCYMMELDPKYVDVIIDRWETYTGQKAKLIKGEKQ